MSDVNPILVHVISSRSWGGVENHALDICRTFLKRGWKVNAFTSDCRPIDNRFARAGIKVLHAPLNHSGLSTSFALRKFIRRHSEPIVIHVYDYKDAFWALLARRLANRTRRQVKVVCTHHTCAPARKGWLMSRIYGGLDAFLFVSELSRRRFFESWDNRPLPFARERLFTLYPSLDIREVPDFTPISEKGPFILLYLGILSREKGIELLIRTLPLLKGKRIRLSIVGTGKADYIDYLHRLADRLGVSTLIDWKGWKDSPYEAIREAHAGISVCTKEEPFSRASLEIMASARTQIVPCTGALREYLKPIPADELPEGISKETDSVCLEDVTKEAIAKTCSWLAEHREVVASLGIHSKINFTKLPSHHNMILRLQRLYADSMV